MTTRTHTTTFPNSAADGDVIVWSGLLNGDQGDAIAGPWASFHAQAFGTFGAGGSVRLEGSNDGVNYYQLSPAALTAPGGFAALSAAEHPRHVRPNVTAGDGTTNLTVTAFLARAK